MMRKAYNYSFTAAFCVAICSLAFSGCGDDEETAPPTGTSGKGGSAGDAGSGGKGGSDNVPVGGQGGDALGPGGNATGGMPDAMAGAAGDAGAGGDGPIVPVAKCGDGKQDPGEECDDGNKKNGDGCSSTCKSKCEACEIANCTFAGLPEAYNSVEELCFKAAAGDVALDGPAKGAPRSALCTDLVECIRTSRCIADLDAVTVAKTTAMLPCFCGVDGAGAPIDCQMTGVEAKGPCVKEFQRAAETEDNSSVAGRLFEALDVDKLSLAVGRATYVAQSCDLNDCAKECYYDKASDTCSRCTLGAESELSLDTGGGATCGVSAVACDASTNCSAVVACGRQTKCAATSVQDCYLDGAGPCAAQIKTASGLTDVAAIKAALDPSKETELGFAASLLGCMKSNCSAQCFP